MVLTQIWNGAGVQGLPPFPETIFPVVGTRRPDAGAAHVHVETEIQRVFPFTLVRSEMRFANVDGRVSRLLELAWQGHVASAKSFPPPPGRDLLADRQGIRFPVDLPVVLPGEDVVGRAMPRRVLAGHDRYACRRANVVRVKVAEPNALRSEPLHVRRAIPLVEWVSFRFTVFTGQHRHRGVHQSHVVDEKDDDIGSTRPSDLSLAGFHSGILQKHLTGVAILADVETVDARGGSQPWLHRHINTHGVGHFADLLFAEVGPVGINPADQLAKTQFIHLGFDVFRIHRHVNELARRGKVSHRLKRFEGNRSAIMVAFHI